MRTDRRTKETKTDRQTNMTKLIVAFRNFANAPKIEKFADNADNIHRPAAL